MRPLGNPILPSEYMEGPNLHRVPSGGGIERMKIFQKLEARHSSETTWQREASKLRDDLVEAGAGWA